MSVIWSGITEQGAIVPVQVDETGKVIATASVPDEYVLRSGDTMTGPLVLPGNPTQPLEAATKGYVDSRPAGNSSVYACGEWNFDFELLISENVADFRYRGVGDYEVYFQAVPQNTNYIVYCEASSYNRMVFPIQKDILSFRMRASYTNDQQNLDTNGRFWVHLLNSPDFRSISKSV